jgi:hypothetical protein
LSARNVEVHSATDPGGVLRIGYVMRVAQTWEQISLLTERESEDGGLVRMHSDLASIRVGMLNGMAILRFVYTFEENLPRREGVGTMARQFSRAATLEFRRDGEAWVVAGHSFDDIGRSGQISLRQVLAGVTSPTAAPPPVVVTTEARPAESGDVPDPALGAGPVRAAARQETGMGNGPPAHRTGEYRRASTTVGGSST